MTDSTGLRRVLEFVEDETTFATSHYDDAYLDRRVSARMRRVDVERYGAYLERLRTDEAERAALLDALSINVTSFFRDPDVWAELRSVLRSLAADRRRATLWSAACSDGREPYSLAMLACDDPETDADRVDVLGTDIDDAALDEARRGAYESTQTTDVGEQLGPLADHSRFVEREDDRFEVTDRVRDLVTFEHHDLIRGEPKSGMDLVLCRNLFIYIDGAHKLPILRTVAESLRDRGYLVIGKTETLPPALKAEFEPVDRRLRIYRKTGEAVGE